MCLYLPIPAPRAHHTRHRDKERKASNGKKRPTPSRSPSARPAESRWAGETPVIGVPRHVRPANVYPSLDPYIGEPAWLDRMNYQPPDVLPALQRSIQKLVDNSFSEQFREQKLELEALKNGLDGQSKRLDDEYERRQQEEHLKEEQAAVERARRDGIQEGRRAAAQDLEQREKEDQRIRGIMEQDRKERQRIEDAVEQGRKEEREKMQADGQKKGRGGDGSGWRGNRARRRGPNPPLTSSPPPPLAPPSGAHRGSYYQHVSGQGDDWGGQEEGPGPAPSLRRPSAGYHTTTSPPGQGAKASGYEYNSSAPFGHATAAAHHHHQHQQYGYPPRFYFHGNTQGGVHCYTSY